MKGIILAGGAGTRLHPVTKCISKQLLPIYDKPMIYYPLTTLMSVGIREILIISTAKNLPIFENLLGDGKKWGISLSYVAQPSPDGVAQAFIIGEEFIGNDDVCLILGDNIFYGHGFEKILKNAIQDLRGATVFGYYVSNPERYGVAVFDKYGMLVNIEEKPAVPKSHYAITGLYLYDNRVINIAKSLRPSLRGELEITDVNKSYLKKAQLDLVQLNRSFMWLDVGTYQSMLEASNYFHSIEESQGLKVANLEEVAWRMGFTDPNELKNLAQPIIHNCCDQYLLGLSK